MTRSTSRRLASPSTGASAGNSASITARPVAVSASSSMLRHNRRPPSRSNCRASALSFGLAWTMSTMADVTAVEVTGLDVERGHEPTSQGRPVRGRLPVEIECLVRGTQVRGRIAMALEAPAHVERLGLVDPVHGVDRTVALRAADPRERRGSSGRSRCSPADRARGSRGSASLRRSSRAPARARPRWSTAASGRSCRCGSADSRPLRSPRPINGSSGSRCPVRPHAAGD